MLDTNHHRQLGYNQYFRYDKQGRVSDYMTTYPPSLYAVIWHKYVYARPDYVIDTPRSTLHPFAHKHLRP